MISFPPSLSLSSRCLSPSLSFFLFSFSHILYIYIYIYIYICIYIYTYMYVNRKSHFFLSLFVKFDICIIFIYFHTYFNHCILTTVFIQHCNIILHLSLFVYLTAFVFLSNHSLSPSLNMFCTFISNLLFMIRKRFISLTHHIHFKVNIKNHTKSLFEIVMALQFFIQSKTRRNS